MKKTLQTVFVAGWLLLLAAMGIFYFTAVQRGEVYLESEKRMLAEAPGFTHREIFSGSLPGTLESYLTDRFPARDRLISASNAIRDLLSTATYSEYLAIQGDVNDSLVDDGTLDEDTQRLLDELLETTATPEPAPTPEPTPVGTPVPTPEPAPTVEEPIPVVVPKPVPNAEDFPPAMGVYMSEGNSVTTLRQYSRSSILAVTSVLNKYAGLLPEGGRVIFTMVPQSSRGNLYATSSREGSFYSDFESCINAFGADNVFAISASNILGAAMKQNEYVYFRTDMHWTPRGTYLVYRQMVMQAGIVPAEYDDFNIEVEEPFLGTYYRDNPTAYMRDNADTLELLTPKFDLEWRRTDAPDSYKVIDFIDKNADANDRYTVYLGGPAGPWTYAECDNGREESCLVVTDSFGLAFVPMVAQNYKEVHYYDPRYFSAGLTGHSVSELIELYGITDVYVVVGDLHSFGSGFLITDAANQLG